jgi:Ca-activated chloride channel homolog
MMAMMGGMNKRNFDSNLKEGKLPKESSITYEGTFNEYYFNDGHQSLEEICYLVTSKALTIDPLTKKEEKYISLTFHSIKDGKNERDDLNLIVALDISGSMGEKLKDEDGEISGSKMETSNEILVEIIKKLKDEERMGIVLFDENIKVLQEIDWIKNIDKSQLIKKVLKTKEQGGTDMVKSFNQCTEMIKKVLEKNEKGSPKNNRIIFITDASPNIEGNGKYKN